MKKEIKGKDVWWTDNELGRVGYGFILDDGKIALQRCPKCGRENYAMNVLSGSCTWCPFEANPSEERK